MIDKVGGIIVKDGRVLAVRKITEDDRTECIIPGGKREGSETDLETLERELMEELGVRVKSAEPFGGYDDIAVFENVPIHIEAYLTEIEGEPKCSNEIKEAVWLDRDYEKQGIKVGSILGKGIIPRLIELNMI